MTKTIDRALGFFVLALAVATASLFDPTPAPAGWARQTGPQSLVPNQPVTGTIDDLTFRQVYTFVAEAAEQFTLSMTRESGDLDPYLLLTTEQGAILAISDDGGTGANALIPALTLPGPGRYFVIATRFGQELGSTSGTYNLLVQHADYGTSRATALRYGQSVLGQITRGNPVAFYFVRAQRGEVITITMRRVSGDLDPHLDFATADGQILISNDDDPLAEGTLNASIRDFTILRSDVYLIQATGYSGTEGSFTLTVTQVPPEELGKTLEDALLIDYGMAVRNTTSEDTPVRYFRFFATEGDILAITATSSAASLTVTLLDSTAAELARASAERAGAPARIAAFATPAEGMYYLAVSAAQSATGEFELQLSGRAGQGAGRALEIVYDSTVSGLITDEHTADEYVFLGSAGDVVRVTMGRVSGDLDALVTIYDRDRKQIAFDDDGAGDKDARIDAFTLPYDGVYILVASRYQRDQGQTTGAYILRLERIDTGE